MADFKILRGTASGGRDTVCPGVKGKRGQRFLTLRQWLITEKSPDSQPKHKNAAHGQYPAASAVGTNRDRLVGPLLEFKQRVVVAPQLYAFGVADVVERDKGENCCERKQRNCRGTVCHASILTQPE
jgi:hypothetical protein